MSLSVIYWGGDSGGRVFDVLVDDHKLATETLEAQKPNEFVDVDYVIPSELTQGKQRVTVRFQAHPGCIAGGLFGLSTMQRKAGPP